MGVPAASNIARRVEEICSNRPVEYKALVGLAAMTVVSLTTQGNGRCRVPKGYVEPWLVRTNFADIVQYVKSKYGAAVLQQFPMDVLAVSQVAADAVTFPNGQFNIHKFPELAEMEGFVLGRDAE